MRGRVRARKGVGRGRPPPPKGYLRSGGSADALAVALQRQASFWRVLGIAAVVVVAIYALMGGWTMLMAAVTR